MADEHWLDRLSRALARGEGHSRKEFLKLAGATVATLVAGPALPAEAKKKGGPSCPPGLTACPAAPPGGARPTAEKKRKGTPPACRDLTSDVNNCGACGLQCPAGQTCSASTCQASTGCPAGQTSCGGLCKNLSTDNANCGSCGVACTGGKTCQNGSCVIANCPSGQKLCGTACQECCANADCSAGRVCRGGICASASCPGTLTRPPLRDGPALPGDPPLVGTFSTQTTVNGQVVKLDETITIDQTGVGQTSGGGILASHIVVTLGGASLLQIDARPVGGSTETTLMYGNGFHGIGKVSCTFDGSLLQCTVDGRATLPFPPGTDPSKIPFADGKPGPSLTAEPGFAEALNTIANRAKQETAGCGGSARPSVPEVAERFAGCKDCENNCGLVGLGCYAAGMAACIGLDIATLGLLAGSCESVQQAACTKAGEACLKACVAPGGACCPQGCSSGACCGKDDICVIKDEKSGTNGPDCCLKDEKPCFGRRLCCLPTQFCISDRTCCDDEGATLCNGGCCKKGNICTPDGTCCPPGVVSCRRQGASVSVCCGPGEVCTQDGFCCPAGSTVTCGSEEFADGRVVPICCQSGQACRQVDLVNGQPVKVCCGVNNTICGGRCCDSTAPCQDGTCCDAPNRPCGNVCCPSLATCCGGKCCKVGEKCAGGVCCDALKLCGNTCCDNTCCNNVCCKAGDSCVNGACATVCVFIPGVSENVACPGLPGQPACCPIGFECCVGGNCCNTGLGRSCCTGVPGGCCPAGQECCGGSVNHCATTCVN